MIQSFTRCRRIAQSRLFRKNIINSILFKNKNILNRTYHVEISNKKHKQKEQVNVKDICPGCGSKFQSTDADLPGYYIERTDEARPIKSIDKTKAQEILSNLSKQIDLNQFQNIDMDNLKALNSASTIKVYKKEKIPICQRCFYLNHHNALKTSWSSNSKIDLSYLDFLINQKDSTLVYVLDVMDLASSLLTELKKAIIGNSDRKLIILLNKVDLLPSNVSKTQIIKHVQEILAKKGLLNNVLFIHTISAKRKEGIKSFLEKIQGYNNGNIYFLGCTNVGKSELMNSFLKLNHSKIPKITTSVIPGTTMDMLQIPLNQLNFKNNPYNIVDTPGILNSSQLIHYLNFDEIQQVLPNKPFKVKTYKWEKGSSLFFSGLARFDLIKSNSPLYITMYTQVPLHMTNIEKANKLTQQLNNNQVNILNLPDLSILRISTLELKPLTLVKDIEFKFKNELNNCNFIDICILGLGWFSIGSNKPNDIELQVYSRGGHGIKIRKPMIKNMNKDIETKGISITRGIK